LDTGDKAVYGIHMRIDSVTPLSKISWWESVGLYVRFYKFHHSESKEGSDGKVRNRRRERKGTATTMMTEETT
jgi:hypothetical protein